MLGLVILLYISIDKIQGERRLTFEEASNLYTHAKESARFWPNQRKWMIKSVREERISRNDAHYESSKMLVLSAYNSKDYLLANIDLDMQPFDKSRFPSSSHSLYLQNSKYYAILRVRGFGKDPIENNNWLLDSFYLRSDEKPLTKKYQQYYMDMPFKRANEKAIFRVNYIPTYHSRSLMIDDFFDSSKKLASHTIYELSDNNLNLIANLPDNYEGNLRSIEVRIKIELSNGATVRQSNYSCKDAEGDYKCAAFNEIIATSTGYVVKSSSTILSHAKSNQFKTEINSITSTEFSDVADEMFKLSHYGMPEPVALADQQYSKVWIWFAFAAFLFFMLAICLFLAQRRHLRRGEVS